MGQRTGARYVIEAGGKPKCVYSNKKAHLGLYSANDFVLSRDLFNEVE